MTLAAEGVKYELETIINLKEDKPDIAWTFLIKAQNLVRLSIRNNPFNGDYLLGFSKRLHLYENLLFPSMPFASRGCIVKKSECSICNDFSGDCLHIIGHAYMGEICYNILHELDLEEISIVDNPADKGCRIVSYSENGKTFDTFTHREIN